MLLRREDTFNKTFLSWACFASISFMITPVRIERSSVSGRSSGETSLKYQMHNHNNMPILNLHTNSIFLFFVFLNAASLAFAKASCLSLSLSKLLKHKITKWKQIIANILIHLSAWFWESANKAAITWTSFSRRNCLSCNRNIASSFWRLLSSSSLRVNEQYV